MKNRNYAQGIYDLFGKAWALTGSREMYEIVVKASRRMWLMHADPLTVMNIAGLIEVEVMDDLKTIKLKFTGKTMVFKASEVHAKNDLDAQMRIAMMVDGICRQLAE